MADSDFISEKDIPANWTQVTPQAQQAAPFLPHSTPDYMQGTISAALQHDATLIETKYKSAGVPQTPLMPIGPGATAQTNAATQSVIKNFVVGGGSTTLLQTNNINNANQTKLNLLSGSNINLISDQNGGVLIDALGGGGGDGLTHGDAIWELDPAWLILRDDFLNPDTNSAVVNTFISDLRWNISTAARSANFPSSIFGGGALPVSGYVHLTNNATASSTNGIITTITGNSDTYPLLDYPGWKVVWIFSPSRLFNSSGGFPPAFNWGQVSFYIGLANYLGNNISSTITSRPPHFLGLRYDTSTAGGPADTQFVCEYVSNYTNAPTIRINTQGTTAATGMTVSEGKIYRFEMSCVTSGQVKFFLTDGTTIFTTTMTIAPASNTGTINSLQAANGAWQGLPSVGGTTLIPSGIGTKFTISGSSIPAANGDWVNISNLDTTILVWRNSGTQAPTTATITLKMFPAFQPCVTFGNDNQASPVDGSKGIMIDFFSLVWNKGLIAGGATPNSLLPRYW